MLERYKESERWYSRAREVTPGGAQTLSKQWPRFPLGAYPAFLTEGNGAWVTCSDGHRYVDWIMGLAAITLGYNHPRVNEAIRAQLARGVSFSLPTPIEVEVAERLRALIPCAEQIRFTKTGSEAAEAAIRVARAATGRDVIAVAGYHSWHSWAAAAKPNAPGVPELMRVLVRPFEFNTMPELDDTVAAVFLEPVLVAPPEPGYLEALQEATQAAGALLIFDEVVTGCRWALGGAQAYFQVVPDLAIFGKGFANGLPIGWLCGRSDVMRYAELASGTFGGEALALAAVGAVLDVMETEDGIQRLWDAGRRFMQGFGALCGEIPVVCEGYPVHPRIRFLGDQAQACMSLFLEVTARHGLLLHPAGFQPSLSHGPAEIAHSLDACRLGLLTVGHALADGDLARWRQGALYQDTARVAVRQ